ncbi:MAG: nucleoside triphosphate pyrophosphohydrolase [Oscillospiraceae bacterium]|nr:nucleoside triphosphate pyrophosphohydrolase [Oscillospiraceae bacterium]
MVNWRSKDRYGYEDMVRLIHLLRSPDGCPWDQAQTHASIRRNFLEETYEVLEAIDEDDPAHLCEELGDVLTQVVFHGDMEQDAGRFTLEDVYDGVCKKMIRRHPHIFGQAQASGAEDVLVSWDAIKREEKGQDTFTDTLTAVPRNLPANWRAEKLIKKASRAGFAWSGPEEAIEKLSEEVSELRQAAGAADAREELGDTLFAAVGAACALGADPEEVLHEACEKFIRRFSAMEALSGDAPLDTCSRETLLRLWKRAKEE